MRLLFDAICLAKIMFILLHWCCSDEILNIIALILGASILAKSLGAIYCIAPPLYVGIPTNDAVGVSLN